MRGLELDIRPGTA